ncbi:MAG: pilus assembly protein PilP [Mariprofundus sp.]|nr:pilus assembly protein PilP [Mariprofundus sp.]
MKHLIWLMTGFMLSATPLIAAPVNNDVDLPDAMQHMVKAPTIDYANLRDPFASYLARVTAHNQVISDQAPSQQSSRKREKLESFDLDSLRLVAIFSMGGERVAMIEDSSAKGYIIRRGNYLGKNNGQIEKITDSTVFLVEEVRNAARDLIDRQVSLTLNEVNE